MDDLQRHVDRLMQDADFRAAHDSTRAEFEVARALIDARIKENITQKQLAQISGVPQSNISRIESGATSPTITTLQRIAQSMGKQLKIEFIDSASA